MSSETEVLQIKKILFYIPGNPYSEFLYKDFLKAPSTEKNEIINILEDRTKLEMYKIKKAPTIISIIGDEVQKVFEGSEEIPNL